MANNPDTLKETKAAEANGGFSEAEMKSGYRQVGTVPLKEKPGFPGNDGSYCPDEVENDSEGGISVTVKGE
jgi:hypothetical protein